MAEITNWKDNVELAVCEAEWSPAFHSIDGYRTYHVVRLLEQPVTSSILKKLLCINYPPTEIEVTVYRTIHPLCPAVRSPRLLPYAFFELLELTQ